MTQNYKIMNYVKLIEESLSRFGSDYRVEKAKGFRHVRVYPPSDVLSGVVLKTLCELPHFSLTGVTIDFDGSLYALLSY